MASPVAIFDAACGVATTELNRVSEWRDARYGSGKGDDGSTETGRTVDWKLTPSATAPTLVSEPNRRPHLLFQGKNWLIFDNEEIHGFTLDYLGNGSILAIVVKNDKYDAGFHQLFGSVRGPNTQIRFESPTELMVSIPSSFTIQPSTDRFHSYIFRSYKGKLEVYQDGVEVPTKNGKPAKPDLRFPFKVAAVGCWYGHSALHGRVSYISYHDSALKENESDWNNLLLTIGQVCDESNVGWTFDAAPPVKPPTSVPAVEVLSFGAPRRSAGTAAVAGNPLPWGNISGAFPANAPAGGGLFGATAPPVAAPAMRPVGSRPKTKPAWRAVFDGSKSLSLLSSLGEADNPADSTEPRPPLATSFLPANPTLYMLNDGITYRLIQSKAEELEEQYGDETLIKTVDAFCDVLSHYFAPSLSTEEIKQWQALWMIASNENVLSGIRSGEELLRAYYFRCDTAEQNWAGYCCPQEFVLLHRDSSGECFAHGECALFVSYRDACAHKRHTESTAPLYAVPLAHGGYGDDDLTWSSFLPDVEAVSGLLAQMQKLLKRVSQDRIFCSN